MSINEPTVDIPILIECFSEVSDPRIERCQRHKLIDILVIALCSVLTGGQGPTEMETFGEAKLSWLKQFLELRHGIPSHDTFGRVLSLIDPQQFEQCLLKWVNSQIQLGDDEVVPIDGKTLKRSHDKAKGQDAIEIVSAWAASQRLTLGQVKVAKGSNEITAVPQVLDLLQIEGAIVTVDAMHCQTATVAKIREKKADYVVALKKNQKHLHEGVEEYLTSVRENRTHGFAISTFQTIDKEHGRIETRKYWQADAPDFLPEKERWQDLCSVGLVEATREINGLATTEVRYYLSSLPVNAPTFGHAVRTHWGIENSCHWVLDVVLREDDCRIRVGNAAENMSTLRRLAMNLLRREKSDKRGIHVKRLKAALDEKYLLKVLRS